MTAVKNRVGMKFGRLTVIARVEGNRYECLCDCGTKKTVLGPSLGRKTNSCGCIAKERIRVDSLTHGATGTPEYVSWKAMKQRCSAKSGRKFHYYSSRGINISEVWLNSFENFYRDMGPRPSSSHSLDRIDNDRGYEPGNCRWATKSEQSRNRRPLGSTRYSTDINAGA